MSLIKKIKDYYKKGFDKRNCLFTTPSHEQGKFIPKLAKELLGEKFYKCDFSEIEGFDNLRNPEGVIKRVLNKLTKIYNSKQTFILTNGSSSGVIAMMSAVLKEGDKVLVARNCHISVFNALAVTGAVPIWFLPEKDDVWDIFNGVKKSQIELLLDINIDVKAVVITSPTYEGLFSEVKGIADICHKRGIKLLVDEAHGALLNFGDFKSAPAILCGADMSVQSLHKTAGAPNPCALLHISKQSDISIQKVQDSLNLINTTSPSYPLLLACEICVDYLNSVNGRKSIKRLLSDIDNKKCNLCSNIKIYDGFNDATKLLIKFDNISGIDASELLNNKYYIEEEYSNEQSMLFICGIGTKLQKINRLFKCINDIKEIKSKNVNKNIDSPYIIPEMAYTPREAIQKDYVYINVEDSIGKVSAETLIDYPPGIPFLIAGEIINDNIVKYIKSKKIKVCIQ